MPEIIRASGATWASVTGKPTAFTPSAHTHPSTDLSDSTTVGRSLLTATDAATARTVIGAGTSNLAVGTTSSDAKAGNYVPDWAEITSKPTNFATTDTTQTITGAKTFGANTVLQQSAFATSLPALSQNQPSLSLFFRTSYYSGSGPVQEDVEVYAFRNSTTPGDMFLRIGDPIEVIGYVNGSDVRVGSRSVARGGLAGGLAALAADSATVSSTTVTDVTGLSVTVTVDTGRRIRVNFYGNQKSTAAGDRASIVIREGSTNLQISQTAALPTANSSVSNPTSVVLDAPSAGSHTYKISQQRVSGTGNVNITAGAQIFVEDLGPAS